MERNIHEEAEEFSHRVKPIESYKAQKEMTKNGAKNFAQIVLEEDLHYLIKLTKEVRNSSQP